MGDGSAGSASGAKGTARAVSTLGTAKFLSGAAARSGKANGWLVKLDVKLWLGWVAEVEAKSAATELDNVLLVAGANTPPCRVVCAFDKDTHPKSFAMTGWRLGYAIAPKRVIDAMDLLVLNTYTCAAEFTQVAAVEALNDSTNAVEAMVAEYRKRRDLFVEKLNKIPGFRCQTPDGAFYAWVNIEETGLPAEEVAKLLLEEAGVAGIAGAAFGPGGKNYVRFSLVSARNLLEEALDRIQRVSVRWRSVVAR